MADTTDAHGGFYLKSNGKSHIKSKSDPRSDSEIRNEEKKTIYCRICFNEISDHSKEMIINGRFSHEFVNPANITYTIGCFSDAVGCTVQGIPTLEATWFPGYAWSFAGCRQCSEHLGWFFQNNGDRFFGLILPKLDGDI